MHYKERRMALIEKARRITEEPYRYYVPIKKAEEFIDMVGSGKNLINLFSAANGIGKSCLSINMIAHMCFPVGNKFFQSPLFKDFPFLKRGRIVSDATNIKENIVPELKKWLPKGRFTSKRNGKSYDSYFITDTGFEFDIMTFDQDPKEFESVNLGWVWLDEPPPETIYKACVSRLRRGGTMWITATPLTGSAWLYDEIVNNKNNDEKYRGFLEADVWSACEEIEGTRGFLKKADIEKMISQYSDEDMQARVKGKFQHLTGLVFKDFDRKIHTINPFEVRFDDYVVVELIDPHPRNPDAVLWVAVDRKGTKFVIDELYVEAKGNTETLAQRIKMKASNYRVIRRLGDPSMFIKNQHTMREKSLADDLADFGLFYHPATKSRAIADQKIKDALKYEQTGGYIIRPPELFIFNTCERLIFEMEHYRWQEWSGKSKDNNAPKEKPYDKDDHTIECLGRCLVNDPKFIEQEIQQEYFGDSGIPTLDPYYN